MSDFDHDNIRALLERLVDEDDGQWLLVGGGVVALGPDPSRTTEDVDLVSVRRAPDDRFRLMEFASRAGLPIEAVNSAADFFVYRVPGWERELRPFLKGARGEVFLPSPTLFVLLKLGRLSARDLDDCRKVLAQAQEIAVARCLEALDALPASTDPEHDQRRALLRALLASSAS